MMLRRRQCRVPTKNNTVGTRHCRLLISANNSYTDEFDIIPNALCPMPYAQCPMPNSQFLPDLMYDRDQFCKGRIRNVPKPNNNLD